MRRLPASRRRTLLLSQPDTIPSMNRRQILLSALSATRVRGANEIIGIGCIGTGGRAQALMRNIERIPRARIAAVCDVWRENLDKARQIAGPAAFSTPDYRDLLARKDVDVVLIAAPDHQHVPLTVAACAAGKDVYVEKPLTHDLPEGKAVIEAVRKQRPIVQVGTQHRRLPPLQKGYEIHTDGRPGQELEVHCT